MHRLHLCLFGCAVIGICVLPGCSPGSVQHAAHEETLTDEDAAGKRTVQISVWTNEYEVFLEHRLAVAGTPLEFITHVTSLSDFSARSSGPITFVLVGPDGASQELVAETPARPGIYLPRVTFPTPGLWRVCVNIPTGETVSEVNLPPMTVSKTLAEAIEAHRGAPEPTEGIAFLKEQQWRLATQTALVSRRPLVERLRVPGEVVPAAGRRAAVTSPMAGRVLPPHEEGFPRKGDRVEAGQRMGAIEPTIAGLARVELAANRAQIRGLQMEVSVKALQIETEIAEAKARLERCEVVLERTQGLFAEKAKSRRELEEAEYDAKTARAAYEGAQRLQKLHEQVKRKIEEEGDLHSDERSGLLHIALRAPLAGTIVDATVTAGEHVEPERNLFTIIDLSRVWIEAKVGEHYVADVTSSSGAGFSLEAYPGQHFPITGPGHGEMINIGSVIDPATRTVPVIYEVPNPEGKLRIGMFVQVHVATGRAENAIAIPESAVVDEEGRPTAYVQVAGETFEKRYLELGLRDSGFAEVKSGLQEGERVVIKGAYAIRLASMATQIPAHGHAH
ncbi:MAG: efflux RND transporter periplasmic adaptor subunit [Planctomycetes bacterium]|nr:efflux RND transporter periplasmic adaptor subunit [Planctomycetota bacterium]